MGLFYDDEDELNAAMESDQPAMAAPQPAIDLNKYLLEQKQKRDALVAQNTEDASGPNWQAALGALSAGFQGKSALEGGQSVADRQSKNRAAKLTDFDATTDRTVKDTELSRTAKIQSEDDDIESESSKRADQIARELGYKGKPISATQFKQYSPALEKLMASKDKIADRKEAREQRMYENGIKRDEKSQGLKTPFGPANTEDDAKKLKEAFESKKNFDNKIQEMIALRKKHNGGTITNREDVGRGKQLSKDLLLEYKNMAKLGVLSAADEKIINAIIPADPLAYNSPMAALQGQDPILHQLEKFAGDSDRDFKTRIGTRTRAGIDGIANAPPDKTVVKTFKNKKTGEIKTVFSDGTSEVKPGNRAGM